MGGTSPRGVTPMGAGSTECGLFAPMLLNLLPWVPVAYAQRATSLLVELGDATAVEDSHSPPCW